jgi:hypothetical protein
MHNLGHKTFTKYELGESGETEPASGKKNKVDDKTAMLILAFALLVGTGLVTGMFLHARVYAYAESPPKTTVITATLTTNPQTTRPTTAQRKITTTTSTIVIDTDIQGKTLDMSQLDDEPRLYVPCKNPQAMCRDIDEHTCIPVRVTNGTKEWIKLSYSAGKTDVRNSWMDIRVIVKNVFSKPAYNLNLICTSYDKSGNALEEKSIVLSEYSFYNSEEPYNQHIYPKQTRTYNQTFHASPEKIDDVRCSCHFYTKPK